MKKFIAGLLAGIMAASVCNIGVFAAETVTLDFEQSSYNVEVGEEFDAIVDVTENPAGFNNATLTVEYDPKVIQAQPLDSNVEGIMTYESDDESFPLFTYSFINSRVQNESKGVKAYESGNIILNAFISEAELINGKQYLKSMEGTGRLFGLKFKAVGNGETKLKVVSMALSNRFGEDVGAVNVTINGCEADVVVGNGASDNTADTDETTTKATETVSETTTSSNNSSGGGSGSSKETTTVVTEETTEETTEEVSETKEETTESTTSDERLFNDIENYPWAVPYIESLAGNNVINGYSDGSFKPANNIKRADFIIMLLKTIGEEIAPQEDGFSDVDPNAYYANAVNTAKALGIASGNGDGTFSPASEITRQDMMILAKKALEFANGEKISGDVAVLDKFADKDDISAYAQESLAAMVDAAYVNGTGNNIEPKANTTRAQAAVVMSKIYDNVR